MKELDIRITELCDYLHFSRPTMYRFIDNYEAGKYRGIDRGVLSLFRYIDETPNIGKKNVISFIINNITIETDDSSDSSFIALAKKYENSKSASELKTEFMEKLMSSSELDDIADYCAECERILVKEILEEEDYRKIGRYVLFRYEIENQPEFTAKQMKIIKKLTEGRK